jgi:hypothetical protein
MNATQGRPRKQAPPRQAQSIADFAAKTGLAPATVQRGLTLGQIRGAKIGRRWLIPADEVDRLLGTERRPATPERKNGPTDAEMAAVALSSQMRLACEELIEEHDATVDVAACALWIVVGEMLNRLTELGGAAAARTTATMFQKFLDPSQPWWEEGEHAP